MKLLISCFAKDFGRARRKSLMSTEKDELASERILLASYWAVIVVSALVFCGHAHLLWP